MNRKFLFLLIALAMHLLLFSWQTRAETTFIYLAGIDDDFITPADPAAPSADVIRAFTNSGLFLQDFDLTLGLNDGARDRHIVHTFTALPPNIVGAILETRVLAANHYWGLSSDGISLGFKDMNSQYWNDDLVWGRFFGYYNNHPGLIVQDREWDVGDEAAFTLDLSSIEDHWGNTLNLIPDLNSRGFLDIVVNDDTAADFYRLTITSSINAINIKPGSFPNSINLCSGGNIPVIIWGSETLDVNTIDIAQLVFAAAQVKTVGKNDRTLCRIKDVGGQDDTYPDRFNPLPDGYDDLTCHFVTANLNLNGSSTTADLSIVGCDDPNDGDSCVVGDLDYYIVTATDSVNIVKDCN